MSLSQKQLPLFISMYAALTAAATYAETAPAVRKPIDTVTVNSRRILEQLEAQQAQTPGGVTVIDGDDLQQRSVSNLADMLRYVPGVWSDSVSGADEAFFSSRGSNLDATDYDKNGVKLLQDGLPITTADGNNHNRIVDPQAARYAVVARGANGLAYGASTLGGAINVISPTARNSAPLQLALDAGSFGLRSARVTAGTVAGQLDGLVTLETKSFDGYRDHSAQHRSGIYANAGWQFSEAVETRVFATYVDNDQEIAGALTRAQVAEDRDQARPAALTADYGKELETWRLANKTTWTLDDRSTLEFGVSYEHQSLYHPIVEKIMVDFDGPGPMPPVEVFSLLVDTDHRELGAMLRYTRELGAHDLSIGLNAGDSSVEGGNYRNDGGRRDGLSEDVDNSARSYELFALDHWRLAPQWTLVYGAQVVSAKRDVRTTDAASGDVRNPEASYSEINPRLGVIYALNDNSELFASVSRLYEAPTNFELDDDVRGNNETLDAMHGTVFEIGARGSAAFADNATWHWDVTAYHAQIRDEIMSVDDPAAPGTSLSANIDKTIHAGIEALIGASFALDGVGTHRIEPLLSATLNHFEFDSDDSYGDNTLPAAPKYFARGEILYRHSSGFYAGPTFDFVGKRYVDFSNNYSVDSYSLLGLRTGYKAAKWEVYGELKNALDKNYIATVSVLNDAAADASVLNPGAPRAAYVGARLHFF